MATDFFADIAAEGIGGRPELLHEPSPPEINKKVCALTKGEFCPEETEKKITSKEDLFKEIEFLKKHYSEFLKDYAKPLNSMSEKIMLTDFKLDGKDVKIPWYGAPLGNHKQVYITDFFLENFDGKAVNICFKGADYIAVVYVNNICAGIHEGFFSSFEFDITDKVRVGKNVLKVELYNDHIYMGNSSPGGEKTEGDKLYAATGLGWDDAEDGWHHCPAGMGIYNDVYIKVSEKIHITDIYVRPLLEENSAEVWAEVENSSYEEKEIKILLSLYGQNFKETVFENFEYIPETVYKVGMGDSLTEAQMTDTLGKGIPMLLKHGRNIYKIPVKIDNPKIWEPSKPYLYQMQVSVLLNDKVCDTGKQQFGMRSFTQDTESNPKGRFYLNGKKIRLRGANTMGFEQQDVMKKDFSQLIDDILLAKLCNMNFLRLTQRPVQEEVYEYCDKLGLMTQTDLPLFGCMRRTKFAEGIRQAEEMERLVRKHPSNVVVSYINEPFPNADNKPHRHLTRCELETFFECCDAIVMLNNPDRVIKHVDGDYDPPTEGMPDNHCYPMWYNGHGIDIGRLHRGYWMPVKPGWYYGCGEYGAEGLDFPEVMKECYPKEWIKEPFNPKNIVRAQTGSFHYFFYPTPEGIETWVEKSQEHQAFATKMMTEAFRRDNMMISNAIHLFIDAWPSGWMKSIMDCRRNPKKAYFAYRDALEPMMVSLRCDRFTYYEGEKVSVETFICNDTNIETDRYTIVFELYDGKKVIMKNEIPVEIKDCCAKYSASAEFVIFKVNNREKYTLKAILLDEQRRPVTYNSLQIEVFEDVEIPENKNVEIISMLEEGEYEFAGEKVKVSKCGMLPLHFVACNTGHEIAEEFEEKDFSYWYDRKRDMITPILYNTFEAEGFTPILTSGNMDENGDWNKVLACAEKEYNGKRYIICNVDLRTENPVAKRFLRKIMTI